MKKFFTIIEKVERGTFGDIIGGRIQIRGGRKGRGKLYKAVTWSGNRGKEAAWDLLEPTLAELRKDGEAPKARGRLCARAWSFEG